VTTVESCAIALAMAGGRPEYLPVLMAAVEAFLDEDRERAASSGVGQRVSRCHVNGPLGAQIRLNAGFGCLGPDPQRRRARASAARSGSCSRISAAPCPRRHDGNYGGIGTRTWSSPKTRRICPPAGRRTASSATASRPARARSRSPSPTGSPTSGGAGQEGTPEEDALQGMYRMADFMRVPNMPGLAGYEHGTPAF